MLFFSPRRHWEITGFIRCSRSGSAIFGRPPAFGGPCGRPRRRPSDDPPETDLPAFCLAPNPPYTLLVRGADADTQRQRQTSFLRYSFLLSRGGGRPFKAMGGRAVSLYFFAPTPRAHSVRGPGYPSVLAILPAHGRSGEFERCVYRVRDTSGERAQANPRRTGEPPRAPARWKDRPPGSHAGPPASLGGPMANSHEGEPSVTGGRSALPVRARLLSPRWYPQRGKRTPGTPPACDARAATVRHLARVYPKCFLTRGSGRRIVDGLFAAAAKKRARRSSCVS
jgi:hypothetical protein